MYLLISTSFNMKLHAEKKQAFGTIKKNIIRRCIYLQLL